MFDHFQPSDIKKYTRDELNVLCDHLRETIKDTVLNCGGHLASNLGVVELTVALHYCFDFPQDKIVFDVGHQCYAHKILSGRYDAFSTLRQKGGLSGFPKREESEYDCYNTGHAGTSVSAALGIAKARDLKRENYNVIALIGDGSFNNGLVYEALNSLKILKTRILIILNDNGMSISPTVGGMHAFLSDIKKQASVQDVPLFEHFGLRYVGVRDANNLDEMIDSMEQVKELLKRESVILHVVSQKGRGYRFCEEHPADTHGVPPCNFIKTGEYGQVLGTVLSDLASEGENIVAVTAAMTDGLGLNGFFSQYPERAFDVGICEEHACVLCTSLAASGMKPYYVIYSTFLQRAYDEIIVDACSMDLPVVFCIDRGGISGADGETHQGVFDLSYLKPIPNLTVFVPKDQAEFALALKKSVDFPHPLAIRYPRESKVIFNQNDFAWGSWEILEQADSDVAVLAVGERMLSLAKHIFAQLKQGGKPFTIINARFVKPLDTSMLDSIAAKTIITLEDNMLLGGFGESVAAYYCNTEKKVYPFAYQDRFIPQGSVAALMKENGVDEEEIRSLIVDCSERNE